MAQGKLTDKQELFAQEVAMGATYSDAYRKAYDASKMAQNGIWAKSSELMDNVKVADRVAEIRDATFQKVVERNVMTIEELLDQMAAWMRFDPITMIDPEDKCTKNLEEISKEARMSISEVHVQEIWGSVGDEETGKKRRAQIGQVVKLKFYDKTKVADMFMKKFNQYVQEVKHSVENLEEFKEILDDIGK